MAGMRSFFSVASLSMGSLRGNLGFNEETRIRTATCGAGKTLEERFRSEFEFEIIHYISRVSNIESNNSQNVGLEDYNNMSEGIFPYFL